MENVNIRHKQSFTRLDKFAFWITSHIGTMGFFIVILTWTILWILWNILAPVEMRFDVLPAFALWLFISNMIQLLLLPLIMIGQNLQSRHAELRAENEYEINLKAEKEIEAISEQLKKHEEMMAEVFKKIR